MGSTYLCKVDERVLKLMTSVGATMQVIELETPSDISKFNTIVRAMTVESPYTLNRMINPKGLRACSLKVDIASIFIFDNQRYYSTTELLDMLTELKTTGPKVKTKDAIMQRIDNLMDQIIWQQRELTRQKKR